MAKRILLSGCELDSIKTILTVVSALSLSLCVSSLIQCPLYATENLVGGGVELPNIAASNIFDTHSMILGDNIKNLVILIPNEAHESTN
jgi:hypothetical protein